MERIIWMYGSAGSTESIIFMPQENTRKEDTWQVKKASAVSVLRP